MKVSIRNFRAIKEADVQFDPGITLIYAKNASGKSTLIKALKALLDGSIGDANNVRHGKTGFSIKVEEPGGHTVTVSRERSTTAYSVDGSEFVTKLGKGSFRKHFPNFPFRREEYQDSNFYPNFSFQNSVPLFDDVSVFDLCSTLFGQVAKLSDCVDTTKKELKKLDTDVTTLTEVGNNEKEMLIKCKEEYKQFTDNNPNIEEKYRRAEEFQKDLSILRTTTENIKALGLSAEEIQKFKELEPAFENLEEILPYNKLCHDIAVWTTQLEQEQAKARLIDTVDTDIIEMEEALREQVEKKVAIETEMVSVNRDLERIQSELKEKGCPLLVQGMCPLGEKNV